MQVSLRSVYELCMFSIHHSACIISCTDTKCNEGKTHTCLVMVAGEELEYRVLHFS